MDERREVKRANVDEVAYISGGGASLRCRVFNISEKGAAIELPTKQYVKSNFKLMLERDRTVRSCRLVWASDKCIGVAFIHDFSADGAPDPVPSDVEPRLDSS